MAVASLENCKKLHAIYGWERADLWVIDIGATVGYYAYDLGYLMRKVPKRDLTMESTVLLGRAGDNKGWSCIYQEQAYLADTPEDAVARLLIHIGAEAVVDKMWATKGY